MLDQNIAIILSTLLGGVLTIIGGFIANHYTQLTLKNAERWKELRNITEAPSYRRHTEFCVTA